MVIILKQQYLSDSYVIAASAIVKLNLQTKCTPSLSSLVPSFTGISEVLLLKLADGIESTKTILFCLGKEATLASHDKELSTTTLHIHIGSASLSHPYYLDEFKARLRMSFRNLIRKPSELHLLSAIQTIERALVGVYEGCPIFYEIITGNVDGGKVSSTVAAGIDCLDLVLEYISGRKRLSVVKKNIQSLVAALFNIVLHLQSPLIFYQVAMHSLYIYQRTFQDFDQLRISQDPASSNSLLNSDNQDCNTLGGMNCCTVDLKFSVELYTACCQLLYTILKHHKRESERCISLLQESERVLLHCLEMVDVDLPVRKGYFSLGVPEGVKCACSFRRIYEELRQQKMSLASIVSSSYPITFLSIQEMAHLKLASEGR
ncbi:hypothetical protein OIU77_020907 [Salix suchowensis]|uniref:Nucleolar 27S pre-rRNA processing Urb2/Npa2 C-terminal domain-containing protein n=1 Tax=Salix suchowensis TaxID=1278906 RepID=A0ABQ9CC00_9ROSI|nr:hypothetical protein OIU77_020907 [Salix suchowensis]